MIDTIVNSFDIWSAAQGIKSRTRVKSVDNISLEGTTSLRKLILDLAIQGKLTIHDPNDEPASKLLARIIEEKNKLILNRTQASELKNVVNEKPFQLPDEWIWSKLGNLGITQTGSTPKTTIPEYFNGGEIPFIGPGQINRDGSIMESDKFLTEKGSEFSSTAEHGDIVMVCIGGSIGKSAIVQSKITFNQQLNSIRPLLVQSNYLQTALNSTLFQNSILEKSTGSATPIINRSKWESIAIPLPPIEEQYRIVAKLDELMALCDTLEEILFNNLKTHQVLVKTLLETLTQAADANELQAAWERMAAHFDTLFCTDDSIDQLKQTILQLAVMGKLVKQNPNDEPAIELLKRIAKEKEKQIKEGKIKVEVTLPSIGKGEFPFKVPHNWSYCRMQDLCPNISSGSTPANHLFIENGIPFLKVYNIRNQQINFNFKKQFISKEIHSTSHKRSLLKPGDVIMNIVGPPLGKVAIIPDEYAEWNCNQAIVFFKPLIKEINKWLYMYLSAGTFLKDIELIGTAGQDNISVTKSKNIIIPLPPLVEQYHIISKVEELFALCESLKARVQKSQSIKILLSKTIVEKAIQ